MTFDPTTEKQRKSFFRHSYGAHLPGYTGHCPTLKFRVGKRFGANTEDIIKELLEKKILKSGPYRPSSGKEMFSSITNENNIQKDWKREHHYLKSPPYILGYTGYIPGFYRSYGLPFMRAVEEGAKEWQDVQTRLKARMEATKAHVARNDPRELLARVRTDNIDGGIRHGRDRDRMTFDYQVSPERPPIVGYTGHIPCAKGEVALSKRYAQAARKGLEFVQERREEKLSKSRDMQAVQRVIDTAYLDDVAPSRS